MSSSLRPRHHLNNNIHNNNQQQQQYFQPTSPEVYIDSNNSSSPSSSSSSSSPSTTILLQQFKMISKRHSKLILLVVSSIVSFIFIFHFFTTTSSNSADVTSSSSSSSSSSIANSNNNQEDDNNVNNNKKNAMKVSSSSSCPSTEPIDASFDPTKLPCYERALNALKKEKHDQERSNNNHQQQKISSSAQVYGASSMLAKLDLSGCDLTLCIELELLLQKLMLDISSKRSIDEIPNYEFERVYQIDLSNNHLSPSNTLPISLLKRFTSLTTFFLTNNKFTQVPLGLGELSSITRLSLKSNLLTSVNAATQLPFDSLIHLILTDNKLREIRSFGALSSLKKLMLAGNELTTIEDLFAEHCMLLDGEAIRRREEEERRKRGIIYDEEALVAAANNARQLNSEPKIIRNQESSAHHQRQSASSSRKVCTTMKSLELLRLARNKLLKNQLVDLEYFLHAKDDVRKVKNDDDVGSVPVFSPFRSASSKLLPNLKWISIAANPATELFHPKIFAMTKSSSSSNPTTGVANIIAANDDNNHNNNKEQEVMKSNNQNEQDQQQQEFEQPVLADPNQILMRKVPSNKLTNEMLDVTNKLIKCRPKILGGGASGIVTKCTFKNNINTQHREEKEETLVVVKFFKAVSSDGGDRAEITALKVLLAADPSQRGMDRLTLPIGFADFGHVKHQHREASVCSEFQGMKCPSRFAAVFELLPGHPLALPPDINTVTQARFPSSMYSSPNAKPLWDVSVNPSSLKQRDPINCMTYQDRFRIIKDIIEAVAVAHARGVVIGDIYAHNIFAVARPEIEEEAPLAHRRAEDKNKISAGSVGALRGKLLDFGASFAFACSDSHARKDQVGNDKIEDVIVMSLSEENDGGEVPFFDACEPVPPELSRIEAKSIGVFAEDLIDTKKIPYCKRGGHDLEEARAHQEAIVRHFKHPKMMMSSAQQKMREQYNQQHEAAMRRLKKDFVVNNSNNNNNNKNVNEDRMHDYLERIAMNKVTTLVMEMKSHAFSGGGGYRVENLLHLPCMDEKEFERPV